MRSWDVPERFNFARDVVERRSGPAITFVPADGERRELSFAEVDARTAQWANLLAGAGVAPGDRVLVLVGKTPEWHPIMLALLRLGAVSIPCSEMLRHKDLAFRVEHSGARLVVADRPAEAEVGGLDADVALHRRGRAGRGAADTRPARTRPHGHGLHPLHVRDDEGPEGRRPHARVLLREADAGRALAGGAARRPRLVHGRRPAGRSRSGTSCSARGAPAPRSCCTRARSTPRSASGCSPTSA